MEDIHAIRDIVAIDSEGDAMGTNEA